jgi:hypothetical protein
MNPRRSRSRSPRGSGGESTRPLAEVAPSSSTSRWAGQRGDPDRDITAQLFLSPCTVEYHLQNVYWKLGVAPILPRTGSGLLPGRTRNCQGHSELPHALSGLGHEPGHRWPMRVPGPLGGLDRREDTELALRERHQALGSASTIANVRCSVFSPPGIQVARRDDCWSRRWRDIRLICAHLPWAPIESLGMQNNCSVASALWSVSVNLARTGPRDGGDLVDDEDGIEPGRWAGLLSAVIGGRCGV